MSVPIRRLMMQNYQFIPRYTNLKIKKETCNMLKMRVGVGALGGIYYFCEVLHCNCFLSLTKCFELNGRYY